MQPDFERRQQKLRELIKKEKIDLLALAGKNDIYYYTGYMPVEDHGFILLMKRGAERPILLLSGLENSERELKTVDTRLIKNLSEAVGAAGKNKSAGFDQRMSCSLFSAIRGASRRWKPLESELRGLRAVKEAYEIEQIKESIRISGRVWKKINPLGRTETGLCNEIESMITETGARPSFETIVLSGKNASYIHRRPGHKRIRSDELVVIDFGVRHNWYCSDITRTLCRTPSKKQKSMLKDAEYMQSCLIDRIVPGVRFSDIDKLYEKLSVKLGYKSLHAFGHGVGLSVHERPCKDDTIQENMILTVEPGVYVKNFSGCRIEDMVLVKKNRTEVLSKAICPSGMQAL